MTQKFWITRSYLLLVVYSNVMTSNSGAPCVSSRRGVRLSVLLKYILWRYLPSSSTLSMWYLKRFDILALLIYFLLTFAIFVCVSTPLVPPHNSLTFCSSTLPAYPYWSSYLLFVEQIKFWKDSHIQFWWTFF